MRFGIQLFLEYKLTLPHVTKQGQFVISKNYPINPYIYAVNSLPFVLSILISFYVSISFLINPIYFKCSCKSTSISYDHYIVLIITSLTLVPSHTNSQHYKHG